MLQKCRSFIILFFLFSSSLLAAGEKNSDCNEGFTISIKAKGKASFLSKLTAKADDYYLQPKKYYHYRSTSIIHSNNLEPMEITSEYVAMLEVLPNFEGRSKVQKNTRFLKEHPPTSLYEVKEEGKSLYWDDHKGWEIKNQTPDVEFGWEYELINDDGNLSYYKYRKPTHDEVSQHGGYKDIVAIEMTLKSENKTVNVKLKATSFVSKKVGFLGMTSSNESKGLHNEEHTSSMNVTAGLVGIYYELPTGFIAE